MKTTCVALLLVAAMACGVPHSPNSPAAGPHDPGLRLCIEGNPKSFDPLQVSDENSGVVRVLTGATLLRIDRLTDELRPELAESWTISPDGRSIAFRLRSGLKFSDGTPLTANEVARALRTAFDPKNASPVADAFRSERGLPDFEVASPLQITIRYAVAKAGLDRLFDQLYIASYGSGKVPAPAGPFFVSDYRPGVVVTLKRNPYYWKRDGAGKQLPYLDSIRLDIQANRDIAVTRFLHGEIDMIRKLDPEDFARISKQMPAAAHDLGPSMDTEFLWFNQTPAGMPAWKRKWFTSAAFRHAVSASIDRQDIARIAYLGHARPAAGPLSPANRYWFNPELKPLPFDSDSALRLLRGEGFTLAGGFLRDRDGHAVEFSLITNAGSRTRREMAALIQADLRKIGARVAIVPLDFGSLVDRISRTSQYDACLLGFTNVAADPIDQMNLWLSSGPQHAWWPEQKSPATAWEARIDQLVLSQASEASRDLRRQAFNEVQRIMVDREPIVYLVNPDYLSVIAPSVREFEFSGIYPEELASIETLRLK